VLPVGAFARFRRAACRRGRRQWCGARHRPSSVADRASASRRDTRDPTSHASDRAAPTVLQSRQSFDHMGPISPLDFSKDNGTPTFKKPIKPARRCFTLACRERAPMAPMGPPSHPRFAPLLGRRRGSCVKDRITCVRWPADFNDALRINETPWAKGEDRS
jgi:hypothetical protein